LTALSIWMNLTDGYMLTAPKEIMVLEL
jgi:hypothetical protein